jgi:hypothetical protein
MIGKTAVTSFENSEAVLPKHPSHLDTMPLRALRSLEVRAVPDRYMAP